MLRKPEKILIFKKTWRSFFKKVSFHEISDKIDLVHIYLSMTFLLKFPHEYQAVMKRNLIAAFLFRSNLHTNLTRLLILHPVQFFCTIQTFARLFLFLSTPKVDFFLLSFVFLK